MALLKKKATLAADANIQQEIINAAGMIYNYLSDKGEVSISKLKKDLNLYENFQPPLRGCSHRCLCFMR